MNPNERKEDAQSIAALYALGALDQQEARVFETHLAGELGGVDEDLAAFQCIVAAIGLGAPERQPSPSVRDRLCLKTESSSERRKDLMNHKPARNGTRPLSLGPGRGGCL